MAVDTGTRGQNAGKIRLDEAHDADAGVCNAEVVTKPRTTKHVLAHADELAGRLQAHASDPPQGRRGCKPCVWRPGAVRH